MKTRYIYFLSIIVLIITAFFSTGYHHFDEHFQILEFAGLKLNITQASNLPWEYHYQMRSAIQPALVVILYQFFNFPGIDNPFTIALMLRLFSATIAFTGMYLIYKTYERTILDSTLKKWFLLLSFFLWFMIYDSVRYSSENWSGSIFIIAFSLLKLKENTGKYHYLYVGLLLGLSFLFRFQAGFLISGLILWYLFIKKNISGAVLLTLGVVILIGIGILIDRWFYGEWTLTTWNYFNQAILLNKVKDFGSDPWWYYFEIVFIKTIPPFSIIFIFSIILFFIFKSKNVLTWIIFPFLLIHFIIGHKEARFLFPIIGFLPIIIIKVLEIIQEKWHKTFLENKFVKFTAKSFWIANIIALLIIIFKPADNQISLYKKLYTDYNTPTTLFYIEDNPYHRILDINFYKRKNLDIIKINSVSEINSDVNRKQLFVTKDRNTVDEIKMQKKLVYCSFPDWIYNFDFNKWIERTKCWYVYEIF
jgi:phosphatidylinositol glycan class B